MSDVGQTAAAAGSMGMVTDLTKRNRNLRCLELRSPIEDTSIHTDPIGQRLPSSLCIQLMNEPALVGRWNVVKTERAHAFGGRNLVIPGPDHRWTNQ